MAKLKDEVESNDASVGKKLEVVAIPVSDTDRLGEGILREARLAARRQRRRRRLPLGPFHASGLRVLDQFGRNLFGNNVRSAAPGSAQGLYLIVADIEAAREELVAHGVNASEVFHCSTGYACRFPDNKVRVSGPHPEHDSFGSFVSFSDLDGSGWLLQEVTERLPWRVAGNATYSSTSDLAKALRLAAAEDGQHEARTGQADPNWPDWYAEYMVREQSGKGLPQ